MAALAESCRVGVSSFCSGAEGARIEASRYRRGTDSRVFSANATRIGGVSHRNILAAIAEGLVIFAGRGVGAAIAAGVGTRAGRGVEAVIGAFAFLAAPPRCAGASCRSSEIPLHKSRTTGGRCDRHLGT